MSRFSFVHAADLHLDTPFVCRSSSPRVAQALREATFQAWDRVIDACLESDAAFLLVAGDVYDASQKSLRAQLRFRDGLERLHQRDIPVFVAHGNHDPLDSRSSSVRLPSNTRVFGPDVETSEVRRHGRLLATVTGVSHPHKSESRNLARLFPPPGPPDVLRIALLHANVGAQPGHDPYAPCELVDLQNARYHYWALGHAHERQILDQSPWVVYPGNTQGRSLREAGPRGCFVVEVEDARIRAEPRFLETDVVRWLTAELEAGSLSSETELPDALLDACRRLQGEAGRPVVARLRLQGRSPVYRKLRNPGYAAELEREVRERAAAWDPFVDLAVLELKARPPLDLDSLEAAPDFLGELLRAASSLSPDQGLEQWRPLVEDRRIQRFHLGSLLEDADPAELVLEAKCLCADLLSSEEPR